MLLLMLLLPVRFCYYTIAAAARQVLIAVTADADSHQFLLTATAAADTSQV